MLFGNIPPCRMNTIRSILLFSTLLILGFTNTGFAFLDRSDMEESLKGMEEDLGGTNEFDDLLEELDQAAGENADAYLTITINGQTTTLFDVPKGAWFYSSVQALSSLGIVSGYKNAQGKLTGEYKPANNVTHAEAAKIATLLAGIDQASCTGELKHRGIDGHWAAPYIRCAEKYNFGIPVAMDINAEASRAEVLHYFLMAFEVEIPEGAPPFADSRDHRYKNDIAYAYALEIISGDTNADGSEKGTFRPDAKINRAETAKMARLAMELL